MARLIRPLRRTLLSPPKTLIPQLQQKPIKPNLLLLSYNFQPQRNYISEMRKSAFEGNILRLLRNEIQYELEFPSSNQPVTKYGSFTVDDRPGEQWIRLKRKYGNNEDIKIEATMFDGCAPASKSGGAVPGEDARLHITMIVNIAKGDGDVLEIICSAWPDSIEITKLFIRQQDKTPPRPYVGPEFKELDDELQDSLYEFLEERGISDELAIFLHAYMKNKSRIEFVRWMGTVMSYINK